MLCLYCESPDVIGLSSIIPMVKTQQQVLLYVCVDVVSEWSINRVCDGLYETSDSLMVFPQLIFPMQKQNAGSIGVCLWVITDSESK